MVAEKIGEKRRNGGKNMKSLDSRLYLHDSDRAALAALKAVPGFDQFVKAFMKVWDERLFRIENLSSNLRLSEEQMPKYYNMLPPICEKLGIEVPELYVTLDVTANAYTSGDTHPFIVINSGLFETLPDELIPTVLARECGHIACHHVLYKTMADMLASGALGLMGSLGSIVTYPLQLAFAYWDRCSEFSADRAAVICDGTSEKMEEVCMRFAGYDKDIMSDAKLEPFMEQAKEYQELVKDSPWNKTLGFMYLKDRTHPLTAVRAYESREWAGSERFASIMDYLNAPAELADSKALLELEPKALLGKNVTDTLAKLLSKGFTDVTQERCTEATTKTKVGGLVAVEINGIEARDKDFYRRDAKLVLRYYEPKSEAEIALEHTGEIKLEHTAKHFVGRKWEEVADELRSLGFVNITPKEMAMPKLSRKGNQGNVAKLLIDRNAQFEKNSWFSPDAEVILYYYVAV